MGCVYSRDERPKQRPSSKTRQHGGQTASRPTSSVNRGGGSNKPIQMKNTVKREAASSSQPTVTQVEKVKRSESTSPTSRDSGVDVASNTALNQTPSTTTTNLTSTSLEAGNDLPFRRQHFDRNSVLRHSKKRRKSSSAGQSTNNTPVKHNNSSVTTSPPESRPTVEAIEVKQPLFNDRGGQKRSFIQVEHGTIEPKKESSLEIEAPVVEAITTEQMPSSAVVQTTTTTTNISVSKMETFSASANVAALLGKPISPPKPPQDAAQLPKTTSETIRSIGSTNGLQPRPSIQSQPQNRDKRPQNTELMPNKSRRASAPSGPQSREVVNAGGSNGGQKANSNQRKWSQQHNDNLEKTASSQNQANGHSNGGRRPLRTRREAEATTNGHNGVHDEVLGDEDCGRLI